MRVIEVDYDEREGLVALDFDYPENETDRPVLNRKIQGDKVKFLLDRVTCNKTVIGRKFYGDSFEFIRYDDVCIKIYNYKYIRKCFLLHDYVNRVDKYIKKKKKNVSSKVKRVNKYKSQSIVAGAMVLLILFATIVAIRTKGISVNDTDIIKKPEYHMTNDKPDINDIDDFDNIIKGDNDSLLFGSTDSELGDISEESIEEMIENYIYINYEDRSDYEKTKKTRELYGELIEKYAKMYGLDVDLVIALATQERGIHSSVIDRGGATGLMQIQNGVWVGSSITAYNFVTGKKEKMDVTKQTIADCETNIKIGCMILQSYIKQNNYNILLGLQSYNMGCRGAGKAVTAYANELGCDRTDIINNPNDCGWLDYRKGITGDSLYVEHVLSYIGSDVKICIYKEDGNKVECFVRNYENVKSR